jgi:hypothetical protein
MKYKANPVIVEAFEITSIGRETPDHGVMLMLNQVTEVKATVGMLARMFS